MPVIVEADVANGLPIFFATDGGLSGDGPGAILLGWPVAHPPEVPMSDVKQDVWEVLRKKLIALRDEPDHPLRGYPDPRAQHLSSSPPPYRIRLAPWAVDIAAQLDDRFGTAIRLTVGFMSFPAGTLDDAQGGLSRMLVPAPAPLLDPETDRFEVAVAQAMKVRSGHHGRFELLITNRGDAELRIATNGMVTGRVVDADTGEVVGGSADPQFQPLIFFAAVPGQSVTVPLLVGTASMRPTLGYAVPPGHWAVEVVVNGRRGVLPLEIVD